MAESTRDISGLGLEELKALLVQALEANAQLKAENAELREEIARLKGLKGRPKLKPSGMEKAADASRLNENLRQAGHQLLGLSRRPPRSAGSACRPKARRTCPPARYSLNARTFAPVTRRACFGVLA